MGRRVSREKVMQLLYQMEICKDSRELQTKEIIEDSNINDKEYISDLMEGVFKNLKYLDKLIAMYSKGWKINRISKIDLSILRLSIYEISFRSDIPFNVSINEAVELAKKFSSQEAASFINGILGKISTARILPSEANSTGD